MVSDASQRSAEQPARKRVRDPEARRTAILAAARAVFAERGYAKATIREIAQQAGVTHGLVVLHFRTKEQLFVAAVAGNRDLVDSVRGDVQGLAERVARGFVTRMETADGADPFLALIRSAADDQDAAKTLLRAMREQSTDVYGEMLDTTDLPERIDLLGAHLIGVAFSRYVLADGPLAAMSTEDVIGYLTVSIAAILFGNTPRPART